MTNNIMWIAIRGDEKWVHHETCNGHEEMIKRLYRSTVQKLWQMKWVEKE